MTLDVKSLQNHFPLIIKDFSKEIKSGYVKHKGNKFGKIIYLDNASTTQKPFSVLEQEYSIYSDTNANIHRGTYYLSQQVTDLYEKSRTVIASYINSKSHNIIFTRNTTESINLIANSINESFIRNKDIILSELEHHSNLLPWIKLAKKYNCKLHFIKVKENLDLDLDSFQEIYNQVGDSGILSITGMSNLTGYVTPLKKIISKIKEKQFLTVVDGAQLVTSSIVDVEELGCDFFAFSAHKLYGPTGIGILYVSDFAYNLMDSYQIGGGTIDSVSYDSFTLTSPPHCYEAGTPNYVSAISFIESINFLNFYSIEEKTDHLFNLYNQCYDSLSTVNGISILGNRNTCKNIISFNVKDLDPNDIGTLLSMNGISARTGHHCTQPLIKKLNLSGVVRVSFSLYNDIDDIKILKKSLTLAIKMLK